MANKTELKTLSEINFSTIEGKYLMAALAKITTESQTDKTPDEVIEQCTVLVGKMFEGDQQAKSGNEITVEMLEENGWDIKGNPVFSAIKCLSDKDSDSYHPDSTIDLVVHMLDNSDMFALSLPDGTLVNIDPRNMDELNLFERMIISVEPSY